MSAIPPRRKKWTEAEEKALLDKYQEMVSNGSLAKMRTREKKFRPIAYYVNSVYHMVDPVTYPWSWSWKDVSTKVQNMRHQYLLVKQKVRRPADSAVKDSEGMGEVEEFDWLEGLSHWSNFLRYKDVFGDLPVVLCGGDGGVGNQVAAAVDEAVNGAEVFSGTDFEPICQLGYGDAQMFLGFECEEDDGEGENGKNISSGGKDGVKEDGKLGFVAEETRRKGKSVKSPEKCSWGFVSKQLARLRDTEARYEQREREREQERLRMEGLLMEFEQGLERKLKERGREKEERERATEAARKEAMRQWEEIGKDREDREVRRREELLMEEKAWEDRMHRRRLEWRNRIENRLNQHRAEMDQMNTRILNEQQNVATQLFGIISQLSGHTSGLSAHPGTSSPYLSPVMQSLHHVNEILHGDARVDDDNQDDHFIVDG
ncbi:hypothetical protein MLD38_011007 [Melastoma candidum]|uniref:Uncharacterized protein n=2 Tax=Melastoma candidum TaxID=119954 RepID=A0ACB9R1C5_9MYRT|nr:hypothetical protein MLD38_011007 [Melastoma candidum]